MLKKQAELGPKELTYYSTSKGRYVQDAAVIDVWAGPDSNATLTASFEVTE